MKGQGAAGILLILVAMFLLMLAFSGKFHDILVAAFPSLGTSTPPPYDVNTSGSGPPNANIAPGYPGGPPNTGNVSPNPTGNYNGLPQGGAALTPNPSGGYQYAQ